MQYTNYSIQSFRPTHMKSDILFSPILLGTTHLCVLHVKNLTFL